MPLKLTFQTIAKIGLSIPGAELGTAHGAPALKANGRMFAVMATNKTAEPDSLCLCVAFEQRDELIAEEPDTYYTAEHYLTYPCVLVRLRHVHRDALRGLLAMGCGFALSKARRPPTAKAGGKSRKSRK